MPDFRYRAVSRDMPRLDRVLWFVVEVNGLFELAPWFEDHRCAFEIAAKVTRGDEFCEKIPVCPVGTPVPRPVDQVWVPSLKQTTLPERRKRKP